MTRPHPPAAVWSCGLGICGAAVAAVSTVLGSLPNNAAAVRGFTVVLLAAGLSGAVAAGLGAAALRQLARDRTLAGRPPAIVGLVLGVLLALPVPWFVAAALGLGFGGGLAFLLGILLTSAGLFAVAYVVYRWQAAAR